MRVLIRADASAEIGTGHVMRCLALAQHIQEEGGAVTFAVTRLPESLVERLEGEGFVIRKINAEPGAFSDAQQTTCLAVEDNSEWVVIDGYSFGGDYQRWLREGDARLLAWDDYGHAEYYHADLILNQNISSDPSLYEHRESHSRLLLGTEYAVLRREFREKHTGRDYEQSKTARRLLVTLGGGDPDNVTSLVLEALEALDMPDLCIRVVVGNANLHEAAIREMAERSRHNVTVLLGVDDMAGLMTWADVAVSAGGSTCWELAFIGVPNLIIVTADNQRGIAEGLAEAGASINAGWHCDATVADLREQLVTLLQDRRRRVEMARIGRQIVDGKGGGRIVNAMDEQPATS